MYRLGRNPLGRWILPLAVVLSALPLGAQERDLVASQVSVSRTDARLELEFTDGRHLAVSLRDGRVLLDEEDLGAFEAGDALDRAWRSLLSEAIGLSGDALVEALRDWTAPAPATEAAQRIDAALEQLSAPALAEAPPAPTSQRSLLRLLRYADRLEGLSEALDELDLETLQVHVGEDVHVAQGETLEGSLLVVDADVEVDGRLSGDLIVVDGSVRVGEDAAITGDVQLLDARLNNRGEIGGDVQRLRPATELRDRELSDLREQIRADIEREIERGVGRSSRSQRGFWSPFRSVAAAVGGILENLLTFGVLVAIGAILLHFGGGRIETVAATARAYPARSAAVGMAGAFLAFPTWILGIVVLAITIIGIPVAIAWAPLFPLFVGLLALGGALAVAVNVGEWIAQNRIRGFEWATEPNTLYRMAAGLLAVTLVFMVANALQIAGSLLGFLHGLLSVVGTLTVIAMTLVGFGAMLLTRGGTRPDLVGESFSFDDWRTGWGSERWHRYRGRSYEEDPGHASDDFGDVPGTRAAGATDAATEAEADVTERAHDVMDDLDETMGEIDAEIEDMVDEIFEGEVDPPRRTREGSGDEPDVT